MAAPPIDISQQKETSPKEDPVRNALYWEGFFRLCTSGSDECRYEIEKFLFETLELKRLDLGDIPQYDIVAFYYWYSFPCVQSGSCHLTEYSCFEPESEKVCFKCSKSGKWRHKVMTARERNFVEIHRHSCDTLGLTSDIKCFEKSGARVCYTCLGSEHPLDRYDTITKMLRVLHHKGCDGFIMDDTPPKPPLRMAPTRTPGGYAEDYWESQKR